VHFANFEYDIVGCKKEVSLPPWRREGCEEVQLLFILDLGTKWEWVVRVTPRPRFPPGTHWIGGWVGLRAGLDTEARGKILCLCRGSNPGSLFCSQTLYWATPASGSTTRLSICIIRKCWLVASLTSGNFILDLTGCYERVCSYNRYHGNALKELWVLRLLSLYLLVGDHFLLWDFEPYGITFMTVCLGLLLWILPNPCRIIY
jgi:hypothetical protein